MALTPEEQKELEILEAVEAGKLTQEEGNELLELEGFAVSQAAPEEPQAEEPGLGSKALDYGLRGLDYLAGAGRFAASGYADLYNLATDQPLLNKPDTGLDVLKGKAPTTEDYLEKSGMEDSIGRSALGFVGDVALDPTTYLSGGASAVGKAGKLKSLFNPAKKAADVVGDKMIRSGVSKIDETLELAGKGKLSDIMIKENIVGTNKQIRKKIDKLSNRFAKDRKTMYSAVDEVGGKVNVEDILSQFGDYTSGIRSKTGNEIGDQVANQMEDQLMKALPKDKAGDFVSEISLQQASNIKSQVRKNLPDNFYNPFGQVKDQYKQGVDKIGNLFQKNIENAADRAVPGLGQDIAQKNKDWSILLDADSPLGREARSAAGKNYITSVDAMVGAGSFVGAGREGAAQMLVAKKLADAAKTTVVRTRGGKEIKNIGKALDPMMRRGVINYNKENEGNELIWRP